MALPSAYHYSVRRLISDSLAILGLLAVPALFVLSSHAQIHGTPASVTSPGFGGRAINGVPASVTSLGPLGYGPGSRGTFFGQIGRADRFAGRDRLNNHPHHHHSLTYTPYSLPYTPSYVYALPVPYAVDIGPTEDEADDSEDYQGGPTLFDRRGYGAASYVPPVENAPPPHASPVADPRNATPEPPQEPTLLVFKDGHKQEVGNYAIVGQTLFDLTPGHARKIALADLDIEVTQQQNEARGITFQLPPSSQVN